MSTTTFAECDPRVARSRTKLLAAATELLVESGPRAVTVDAVCERSGVAKSTLYRQWDTRNALLVDVLRSNLPDAPEVDLTGGFEPALRTFVRSLADMCSDPGWPRIFPALLMLKHQLPEIAELTADDRECKLEALTAILRAGVAEGRLPDGLDADTVAMMLFGPMTLGVLVADGDAYRLGDLAVERFLASYSALV